jgi:hypothetical protein
MNASYSARAVETQASLPYPMQKIANTVEGHPVAGGWIASISSFGAGAITWIFEHAGGVAHVFSAIAAVIGVGIAWLTFRIQLRTYKKMLREDRAP